MRVARSIWLIGLCAGLAFALVGCGSAQNATVTVAGAAGGSPATVMATPVPGSNGTMMVASGPDTVPLTSLGRRTTGSVTLRTFTTPPGANGGGCSANGNCVPAWCESTQALVTELSTPAMAAVLDSQVIGLDQGSPLSVLGTYGGGSPYGEVVYPSVPAGSSAYSSQLTVNPSMSGQGAPVTVGTAEGDPVQVIAVRVASTVAKVTVRTSHGDDSMAPVHGLAVLAVEGDGSSGSLTATDDHGHTVATVALPTAPTATTNACAPQPPSLPSPGAQPADVAAAQQAVQHAYTLAFTSVPGQQSTYASLALVQDGADLHATLDKLRQNFANAAATATVKVGQIVFTSPTMAALFFTVTYQDGVPYGTQIGHAVLENGSWLVSRDTYCGLMAFGGAACPAS